MGRSSEVKEFYDRFAGEVLLEDFRRLNLRQDALRRLCGKFVPKGSRVLEIGCGVGINARYLRKIASRVLGVDISERSIEVAREYAGSINTEFRVLDILEGGEELVPLGPFDVIVLPDVVEHIPKERRSELFAVVERVLARPGRVLLTYPSPEYQEYLRTKEPETLQVVDETVELEEILRVTTLKLVHFTYRDVWSRNQYVHVVLTSDRSFRPEALQLSPVERLRYRFRKRWWRWGNRSFVNKLKRKSDSSKGPLG